MLAKRLFIALIILAVATAALPTVPAQAQSPVLVYFMHGISGLDVGQPLMQNPVDVSIPGLGCVATNVMFRGYAGPFVLAGPDYTVSVSPANLAAPCTNPATLTSSWVAVPGESRVVLSQLDAAGAPTLTTFVYDLSHQTKDNGKSRFTFVNGTATAGVTLMMKGNKGRAKVSIRNIINAQPYTFQMKSSKYKVQFNYDSVKKPFFGPITMKTTKFHHYFIALVGSAANGYFTASFSVNTYPFNPIPYNPYPWP